MKFIILILTLILSLSSFSNEKISYQDFIKLVDSNKVTWEVDATLWEVQAQNYLMFINKTQDPTIFKKQTIERVIEILKGHYSQMYEHYNDQFLYVRYVYDMPYRYEVTFDFMTTNLCKLRIATVNPACGKPICGMATAEEVKKNKNVDFEGYTIPNKYCEKIYGVKIK